MSKIAMIGDYESSIGFKAVGIDTYVPKDREEAKEIISSLVKGGYGIVFVTEEIADSLGEVVDQINRESRCTVLIIPSVRGSKGLGIEKIRKSVEKAVGIDIFKTS